jgi:protein-S-isoprenylcysteine O-methyltransferase Ste14
MSLESGTQTATLNPTVNANAPLADPGPAQPKTVHWFRGLVGGNTRKGIAWIYAAILILTAQEYPNWAGILICAAGAGVRFWASGYLRKNTRPSVGGPYAHARNPLYLGTYLMQVGASVAVGQWALALVGTVLFAVVYHCVILDEEEKLERIFGAPYQLYLQRVPRFFPSPIRPSREKLLEINPALEHLKFSWELSRINKAHPWVTFGALIGILFAIVHARLTWF